MSFSGISYKHLLNNCNSYCWLCIFSAAGAKKVFNWIQIKAAAVNVTTWISTETETKTKTSACFVCDRTYARFIYFQKCAKFGDNRTDIDFMRLRFIENFEKAINILFGTIWGFCSQCNDEMCEHQQPSCR